MFLEATTPTWQPAAFDATGLPASLGARRVGRHGVLRPSHNHRDTMALSPGTRLGPYEVTAPKDAPRPDGQQPDAPEIPSRSVEYVKDPTHLDHEAVIGPNRYHVVPFERVGVVVDDKKTRVRLL